MTEQLIAQLVAPVVMISACGLIFMALNARLLSILNRLRSFHRERMDIYLKLAETSGLGLNAYKSRFEALEKQTDLLLIRAALTRNALIAIATAVLCNLLCSLSLGLTVPFPGIAPVAITFFILGVLSLIVAVSLAIYELKNCLQLARFEHEATDSLEHTVHAMIQNDEPAHQDPV